MSGYATQIKYPTSLAFAATWRRYRARQESQSGRPARDRRVAMGSLCGKGLVQADADIQIGDELSLESTVFGQQQPDQPRVVAAIDKESRAQIDEWLITWAQVPAQKDGRSAPAVALDPERFTDVMLIWAYEHSGGERDGILLSDFAPGDIPILSVVALADQLQEMGLLVRDPTYAWARMTAHGVAAARAALAERDNRTLRIEALRNRIVLWVHTMSETEEHLDLRDFLHDPAAVFHGRFFTEAELHEETVYLREKGLLKDDHMPWCLYPVLTPTGRDCAIYRGGNVHESTTPRPPQNNTIINFGNHNQNSTGDGAQTAHKPAPDPEPTPRREERPATFWPKFKAFARSTAGVITFVCTLLIAVFAVLTYLYMIKH